MRQSISRPLFMIFIFYLQFFIVQKCNGVLRHFLRSDRDNGNEGSILPCGFWEHFPCGLPVHSIRWRIEEMYRCSIFTQYCTVSERYTCFSTTYKHAHLYKTQSLSVTLQRKLAVLGIRDILVWIRIPGSVPLTNESECRSGSAKCIPAYRSYGPDSDPDADSEHWYIYIILQR